MKKRKENAICNGRMKEQLNITVTKLHTVDYTAR